MTRAGRTVVVLFAAALLGRIARAVPQPQILEPLAKLLPAAVQGWTPAAPDDLYDPESIFSYIDGAGEVYRAYNFRHLLSRRYEKKDGPGITVDLFDMGSPADAFGVNTMDLEGENPGIGQGGTYKDGLLSFWRDRYFVSVMAESETAAARGASLEIGRRIASAIGKDGPPPALLGALPPGLAPPTAVRYLHSPVILNRHYFVHAENVLNLGPSVEAVLARLGEKGRGGALLIVRYPTDREASAAFTRFAAALLAGGAASSGAMTVSGKRGAVRFTGTMFAVVLGADSEDGAQVILDKVVDQVRKGAFQ